MALKRSLREDLFVIMAGLEQDGTITVKGIINPLINWMWLGGIVASLGGFYLLLPEGRQRKESAVVPYA